MSYVKQRQHKKKTCSDAVFADSGEKLNMTLETLETVQLSNRNLSIWGSTEHLSTLMFVVCWIWKYTLLFLAGSWFTGLNPLSCLYSKYEATVPQAHICLA